MSDLVFDLQRFAVVYETDDGLVTVQPYQAAGESGAYYFAENNDVTSTFTTGDVTLTATEDDDDNGATYLTVTELALPGSGSGVITTGTGVGSKSEPIALNGLGDAELTFSGTTFQFAGADENAALNVYSSVVSSLDFESGSFTMPNGGEIAVGDSTVGVDKSFTYTAGGDDLIITVNEESANVNVSSEEVMLINAPSGAHDITVGGNELKYATKAAAVITVESGAVTGFNLASVDDAVKVPAAIASNSDFSITEEQVNENLPSTGYTITKTSSGYFADDFGVDSVVVPPEDSEYTLTNASGSIAVSINNDSEITGLVLGGVSDAITGEVGNIGVSNDVALYNGANTVNVDEIPDGVTISKTAAGVLFDGISADESILLNDITTTYNSKAGSAILNDDNSVGFNIASGGDVEIEGANAA